MANINFLVEAYKAGMIHQSQFQKYTVKELNLEAFFNGSKIAIEPLSTNSAFFNTEPLTIKTLEKFKEKVLGEYQESNEIFKDDILILQGNKSLGIVTSVDNSSCTIEYEQSKPFLYGPTYNKAIKELEGMDYSITPKVIKSQFTNTYSVCVTLDSPWFGSFGTAKQLPGDSSLSDINKAKVKLIIGLWKQARERLLLGQLI